MQLSLTRRQVTLSMMMLVIAVTIIMLVVALLTTFPLHQTIAMIVAIPLMSLLLVSYWRGWDYARYVLVLMIMFLFVATLSEPFVTLQVTISIVAPAMMALVLAEPLWTFGVGSITLVLTLVRAGFQGVYADPFFVIVYLFIVMGMVLSQMIAMTAIRVAETNARNAEEQRRKTAEALQQVEQQAHELEHRNHEQQRLIDLVTILETPTISIADGVLLAPIVGTLDSRRIQTLMHRLLQDVAHQRSRLVVLDIAGVSFIDTAVANALIQTSRAIHLLGCQVTLTGISSDVATTLTHLNLSFQDVSIAHSPQDVLYRLYRTT